MLTTLSPELAPMAMLIGQCYIILTKSGQTECIQLILVAKLKFTLFVGPKPPSVVDSPVCHANACALGRCTVRTKISFGISRNEWSSVYEELFSDDPLRQRHALDRITVWRCRLVLFNTV